MLELRLYAVGVKWSDADALARGTEHSLFRVQRHGTDRGTLITCGLREGPAGLADFALPFLLRQGHCRTATRFRFAFSLALILLGAIRRLMFVGIGRYARGRSMCATLSMLVIALLLPLPPYSPAVLVRFAGAVRRLVVRIAIVITVLATVTTATA